VISEILQALDYAHHKNDETGRPMEIVHRDISPGNILISYRGEVKLSDFGIVKAGQRLSRTDVGLVKGNASYMSPEQARGDVVDSRSDIFSAAVVTFHALTGQALYGGETTLNQLMVRAAVGLGTAQFDQISNLPPQIAPVLSRALSLEPGQRFQTAGEFCRAVQPMVTGGKAELAEMMARLFPTEMRKEIA
jgi:serine/threonine-protein kinase